MKGTSRLLQFIAIILMLLTTAVPAKAALQAVGPLDPATGFPVWYQDASGLAVQECLDLPSTTGNVPFCTLLAGPGFNPLVPISALPGFTNYPVEMFYWVADTIIATTGGINSQCKIRLALEGTFATGVQLPGQQAAFLLVNMQKMDHLPPSTTFTVNHPFGSFTFTTDSVGTTLPGLGGQGFRVRDDTIAIPGVFNTLLAAPSTHIGPFLRPSATAGGAPLPFIVDPITGNSYLANPAIPTTVTGGTNGNAITITGTGIGGPGTNSVSSNLFNLQAKVFTTAIPSALAIDKATYARSAASGQVDLFVTALPTALPVVSGTGLAATPMIQDLVNPGQFFAHLPGAATLPATIDITNNADVPPAAHPAPLVDEVNITQANYNPLANTLTIKANSRDDVAPLPTLTVVNLPVPNTLDAAGTLVKTLTGIPPQTVAVSSSKGGSASIAVSVVIPPPVAKDDSAVVPVGASVVVDVLANDSAVAPATLNAATVSASPATRGTVAVDPVTGAITYTPAGLTAGTDSFSYTVTDSNLQISNSATVSVAVTATASTVLIVPDQASPHALGSAVTFVASRVGGPANNEYRFSLNSGTGFVIARDFSAASSWTWNPAAIGAYDIRVDVRSAGSAALSEAAATVSFFQIRSATLATGVTVTTSVASPQVVGTPVTFTATAVGGAGPFEYRYWLNNGSGFAVAQDFTTVNTFVWTPTTIGNYDIEADVRTIGNTALRDALTKVFLYQIQPAAASAVSVTASKASPQLAGTPIVFTAAGSGGSGKYEYRFWLNSGAGYAVVQDYSTLATWTWIGQSAGTYDLLVDVRSVGSTAVRDALNNVFFYKIQ